MIIKKAVKLLDAVGTPTVGSSLGVLRYQNKTIVVSGNSTPVGTTLIEGSLDNLKWVLISTQADPGTPTAVHVNNTWEYIRARVTAYTSGTITVTLSGASQD